MLTSNHPHPRTYAHFLHGVYSNNLDAVVRAANTQKLSDNDIEWGMLLACANSNSLPIVVYLLEQSPYAPRLPNYHYSDPLEKALEANNIECARLLVRRELAHPKQHPQGVFSQLIHHNNLDLAEEMLQHFGAATLVLWLGVADKPPTQAFAQRVRLLAATQNTGVTVHKRKI